MARIQLVGLRHAYAPRPRPQDYVLTVGDLTLADGVSYALLGPSGCGKTTLLNILSGLVQPSEGRLLFDGKDVTGLDARGRNIAQVFQFPVVYDSMTVRGNLQFPLRNRGWDEGRIAKRVADIAEALELTGILDQRAVGLSADRKQIISLGRGLVRPDVAAVLFDEPLTVIDPHRKWELRCRLRRLQEQFRVTQIYVTHDQTEALTFADEVLVMKDGAVVQRGRPEELHDEPAHEFVGFFIGSPGMNFLPVRLEGDRLDVSGASLPLPTGLTAARIPAGQELKLGIRPAHVELVASDAPGAVPVVVERVQDRGDHGLALLRLGGVAMQAVLGEDQRLAVGAAHCRLPAERCRLYAGGRLVR